MSQTTPLYAEVAHANEGSEKRRPAGYWVEVSARPERDFRTAVGMPSELSQIICGYDLGHVETGNILVVVLRQ
jgi:hypothetical protein